MPRAHKTRVQRAVLLGNRGDPVDDVDQMRKQKEMKIFTVRIAGRAVEEPDSFVVQAMRHSQSRGTEYLGIHGWERRTKDGMLLPPVGTKIHEAEDGSVIIEHENGKKVRIVLPKDKE